MYFILRNRIDFWIQMDIKTMVKTFTARITYKYRTFEMTTKGSYIQDSHAHIFLCPSNVLKSSDTELHPHLGTVVNKIAM